MTNAKKFQEIFKKFATEVWAFPEKDFLTWLNAEYKEPTTKNNLALIHTEGLDEEIRCTMCTNSMKSDRGCDGSCVVNKDMYKAVMDAIEKRIKPTTKNDLGVNCIKKSDAINIIQDMHGLARADVISDAVNRIITMPSVTQEPCDKCEVGNPCLYCKHEFEPQESEE